MMSGEPLSIATGQQRACSTEVAERVLQVMFCDTKAKVCPDFCFGHERRAAHD